MGDTSDGESGERRELVEGQPGGPDDRQRRIDALRELAAQQRQTPGRVDTRTASPAPAAPSRGGALARRRAARGVDARQPGLARQLWRAVGGATLVAVLLAVGALVWLRPTARPTTTARVHAPADPLAVSLTHSPVACPVGAAWSPDGKRVAIVGAAICGQSIFIPGAGLRTTVPAAGGALAIYDSTTGASLATTDISQTILPTAVPQSVRSAPAALAQVALAYPQIIWAPDGRTLAVTFAALHAPPDTGAVDEGAIYGRGVLLLPTAGTARIIPLPRPAGVPDPSILVYDQVDLAADRVTPHMPPASVEYEWYAAQLAPRIALNGPNQSAPAIFAKPIGNPDGDSDFTIWQSGTVSRPCVQRPGAPAVGVASCCVPPEYVKASLGAAAAWSPDSRFLVIPVDGPVGATGRIVTPPTTDIPDACPTPSPNGGLSALPVRDPALAVVAANLESFPGAGTDVAWNASGKRLAALPNSYGGSAQPAILTLYSCDTGQQVVQTPLPSLEPGIAQGGQGGALSLPIWSPDGTRLLFLDSATQALVLLGPKTLQR